MNPRCFQQGRAEVVGLDDTGLATLGRTDPEPQLTSAIDLMGWVDSLPERDQVLVTRRLEGCTLNEIGREVGLSISATLAHLRRLGNALRLRLAAC